MTISSETTTVTVQGNGATTSFAYNFLIPFQDDGVTAAVEVVHIDNAVNPAVETVLSLGIDYTITGVDNAAGGTVEYNPGTPIPATEDLRISRKLTYTQAQDYINQGFLPESVETGMDRLAMMIQQLNTRVGALENA